MLKGKIGLETLRQTLLPFQSHYVKINGERMHYLDQGRGSVVLLLHGNPTWCFYYRNVIAALCSDFRVIAPDYIGCGLSDRPNHSFRAVDRIAQIEALLQFLQVDQFSLVMHDWGGPIGTGLAVDRPESVSSLVYLNTTLLETAQLPQIIKHAASPFPGKILTKHTAHFIRLMLKLGVQRTLPPDVAQGYLLPYQRRQQRRAIWDFVADIPFLDSHPTYQDMLEMAKKLPLLQTKPVKIIWGLKDPCFHREMLKKVAQHFPQAEVLELAEASHLVLEDAPEIAIPAIKEFLCKNVDSGSQSLKAAEQDGQVSEMRSINIHPLLAAFNKIAASCPEQSAVIEPHFGRSSVSYQHFSYQSLQTLINQYQRGLLELGLKPADKVLMLVPPGIDFLALAYAVMARAAVPVFVDPGIGIDNLCRCIADCAPDVMIGVPKAQLLRLLKRRFFKGLRFSLTASDWMIGMGPNLSFLKRFSGSPLEPAPSSGTALVAFTSGATGTPKGVVFSDQIIAAQLDIFHNIFQIERGCKDCPLLPIFSLYSLALGVCSVFAPLDSAKPLDLKPEQIVRIIRDLNVDYSFGSPTLWQKISEYCVLAQEPLSSVKKVLMAGAPVTDKTLKLVQSVLPNGTAFTPYGATEALPVTLPSADIVLSRKTVLAKDGEEGVFVGQPIPGVDLKIMEQSDLALQQWQDVRLLTAFEIGEVIVSGANVSEKYLNRPDATKQAKICDGKRIWHRSGDLGYLDRDGNLYLCGRKMHSVKVGTRCYYSLPVERIFNQHPKVKRSALVNLSNGQEAAIVVEPFPEHWPFDYQARQILRSELLELGRANNLTKQIEKIFFHRSFPVDARHNAKIFRDQLSKWATEMVQKG